MRTGRESLRLFLVAGIGLAIGLCSASLARKRTSLVASGSSGSDRRAAGGMVVSVDYHGSPGIASLAPAHPENRPFLTIGPDAEALVGPPPSALSSHAAWRRVVRGLYAVMMGLIVAVVSWLLFEYAVTLARGGAQSELRDQYLSLISLYLTALVAYGFFRLGLTSRPLNTTFRLLPGEYQYPRASAAPGRIGAWHRAVEWTSLDRPRWSRVIVLGGVVAAPLALARVWDAVGTWALFMVASAVALWAVVSIVGGGIAVVRGFRQRTGLVGTPVVLDPPQLSRRDRVELPWWEPRFGSAWPRKGRYPGPTYHYEVLAKHREECVALVRRSARTASQVAAAVAIVVSVVASVLGVRILDALMDWKFVATEDLLRGVSPAEGILVLWPLMVPLIGVTAWFAANDNAAWLSELAGQYELRSDVPVRIRWIQRELASQDLSPDDAKALNDELELLTGQLHEPRVVLADWASGSHGGE